jgi:hypothetical protein
MFEIAGGIILGALGIGLLAVIWGLIDGYFWITK